MNFWITGLFLSLFATNIEPCVVSALFRGTEGATKGVASKLASAVEEYTLAEGLSLYEISWEMGRDMALHTARIAEVLELPLHGSGEGLVGAIESLEVAGQDLGIRQGVLEFLARDVGDIGTGLKELKSVYGAMSDLARIVHRHSRASPLFPVPMFSVRGYGWFQWGWNADFVTLRELRHPFVRRVSRLVPSRDRGELERIVMGELSPIASIKPRPEEVLRVPIEELAALVLMIRIYQFGNTEVRRVPEVLFKTFVGQGFQKRLFGSLARRIYSMLPDADFGSPAFLSRLAHGFNRDLEMEQVKLLKILRLSNEMDRVFRSCSKSVH